MTAKSVLVRP